MDERQFSAYDFTSFVILFFLLVICSLPIISSLDILQKEIAQTNNTTTASISSAEGAKVLVDDSIQDLGKDIQDKDVNKALIV